MKVAWHPLYSEQGASSRLRVFTMHNALLKMGHNSCLGWCDDADVMVVQKHRDGRTLERLANHHGIRVYDFDDWEVGGALENGIIADLFTTDTRLHAEWAAQHKVKAAVVPDPIDFCPPAPYSPTLGSSVVWFGHSSNFTIQLKERIETFAQHGVTVETLPWNFGTFVQDLRRAGVAYLSHAGQDQGKSNNKAIAAITQGLPVVAESSESYRELLEDAGVGWAYAHDEAEALGAIEVLLRDKDERLRYLNKTQPFVWERYHPMIVAKRWLEAISATCVPK